MHVEVSAIVFFSYLPEAGEYQCLMLYLENSIHFSSEELAAFIAVLGTEHISGRPLQTDPSQNHTCTHTH